MVMQRATHPSPIQIISDHVEAWRRENRWSRETVADLIVQAHERINMPEVTGIKFEPATTDTFERMRVNADRVFRWLDDRTKDKNLMTVNFIWSVLTAMPEDRRVLLLNDLLHPISCSVAVLHDAEHEPTAEEIAEHFRILVDHSAQATIAVSHLLDGVAPGEPEHAAKKLGLAAAAVQKARGLMSRLMSRRRAKHG